jgi:hypothetical protein
LNHIFLTLYVDDISFILVMSSQSSVIGSVIGPITGYKSFGNDWKCLDFQFEVGKTYELPDGQIPILCETGFHFCRIPTDCDQYYQPDRSPRHALIWAWDVIDEFGGNKSVCRKIKIMEEISSDQWGKMTGTFTNQSGTVHLLNSHLHREDGPAIEWSDGTKYWYRNGQMHREDGPASEFPDGRKYWYRNDQLHREDGPSMEWPDGTKYWYRNGKYYRSSEAYALDIAQ